MAEEKLIWHNEKRKPSDLVEFELNPRQMTEKQVDDLKKSIDEFNLVEPPAIDIDNKIVSGHQRMKILAMFGRGDEEIDVRVPNRKLKEEEFKRCNVRMNKNRGEWDWDMLANNYDVDWLKDVGFDKEMESILAEKKETPEVEFSEELLLEHNYVVLY